MKLTQPQKLTAILIVLALVLAGAAAIVSLGGVKPQKRALSTGKLSGPALPRLAFEGYPTEEQEEELKSAFPGIESFYEELPGHAGTLMPFFEESTRRILSAHGGQNQVCSPLNLYMALSMAAEITGGSTRGQILDLLGAGDLESLREQSKGIWALSSLGYYGGETDLGSSLWLNNQIDFREETLDILAKDHFAETFRGTPGTDEYDALLREWTNGKTRNLLEGSVEGLHMDPLSIITLMSTVYFKAAWSDSFPGEDNTEAPFHAPDGDVDCTFMNRKIYSGVYYWGEGFGATELRFSSGGGMVLILPDEDRGIDQVLGEDSGLWEFMNWRIGYGADNNTPFWGDSSAARLNLSLPKFDVSSNSELSGTLKALGMTDAFDPDISDFDPLMRNHIPAYISAVNHAARVMVDEEGCTAASYVEMAVAMGASAPPDDEVDFILDRPFIFLIETRNGLPLFAGVVDRP